MGNLDQSGRPESLTVGIRLIVGGVAAFVVAVLAGLVVSLILGIRLFERCGIAYVIVLITLVTLGTIAASHHTQRRAKRGYWIPAFYVVIAVVSFLTLSWTCPRCPGPCGSDEENIIWIIRSEADAVRNKDMNLIRKIFADNAIIVDAAEGTQWRRDQRYSTLFQNTTFLEAEQFEIQPASDRSTPDKVVFMSGSRGRYVAGSSPEESYYNDHHSNEWTLIKDQKGCWKIVEFKFNIHR